MSSSVIPGPVLCLGDPLVDLVCERPVDRVSDGDAFVPHLGGVAANLAVAIARGGARVMLAGGAGDDDWGAWLAARLEQAGVDLTALRLLPGRRTALALVTVDATGEGRYLLYGAADGALDAAVGEGVESLVDEAGALCIGTNTLSGERERELTMRALAAAHAAGRPVVFDPNLRLHRWRSAADAAASANACVRGALLVRCNAAEATLLTGEEDVERAATALLKGGARMVVISRGAGGALLRGELRADVPGVPVSGLRSTVGAGDWLTGWLVAKLALAGWYPPALAAALPEAVARSAAACERWGAVD